MAENNLLGIEIGNRTAKFVEMKRGKVSHFCVVDLPDNIVVNDELVAFEAMTDIIVSTVRKEKFKTKRVALVIPDSAIFLRRLIMPAMTEKQLMVNMPYEFKDLLNEEKDRYFYDYSIIQQIKDDEGKIKELELLAAVVSKELIAKYQEMFKKASLKLVKAVPREIVLSALLNKMGAGENKAFAVLDLGYNTTKIDIFKDGAYEVTRTIEAGVRNVIDVAADISGVDSHVAQMYLKMNKENIQSDARCVDVYSGIAVEVMRAMNYYAFENPNDNLETLYYCGGGSYINDYVEEIKNTISLKLEPLSSLADDSDEVITMAAAAIGVCYE